MNNLKYYNYPVPDITIHLLYLSPVPGPYCTWEWLYRPSLPPWSPEGSLITCTALNCYILTNRSNYLGIHKQTNACWSIPRSQTVFYHSPNLSYSKGIGSPAAAIPLWKLCRGKSSVEGNLSVQQELLSNPP